MRKTLITLAALFIACSIGQAQTKLSLTQLPGCALTSTTPQNVPIILAIVPTSSGVTQFACFTFSGASITAATATSPATISLPAVVLPSFVDGETPGGTIDGKNAAFTLANVPLVGSLNLYRNGVLQQLNVDYALPASGGVNFLLPASIPQPGDSLQASYRH